MKPLRATKHPDYIIEPIHEEPYRQWEGFHSTNPTVIRLSSDPRVFLGYRAGGDADRTYWNDIEIWGSSLGLAILDERGEKVLHRLPLPIMKWFPRIPLPKSPEEYAAYSREHPDEMLMLHDFRFLEYGEYLYVIFHVGGVIKVYDCVVRMPVADFLKRIDRSLGMITSGDVTPEGWESIWQHPSPWEPCGVNDTMRLFPSDVNKGDITHYPKPDGTLQLCHRPLPDIAVFDCGAKTYADATPDGITKWGVLERSIRPGYTDNSHIGNNGNPVRAKIGDVDVWMDVPHGCHNACLSEADREAMWITYYAYLRIKDAETLEQLYYSEEPILDYDDMWREYVVDGAWVSRNPILHGVMFAGGQVASIAGREGLDDTFMTYVGVGDTAVARASFQLRDLLPGQVIADIQSRRAHRSIDIELDSASFDFPEEISGWCWTIDNDPVTRSLRLTRTLDKNDYVESAPAVINTRPGYFDADAALYYGVAPTLVEEAGLILPYRGVRWDEVAGVRQSAIAHGILLLDIANPQRVLFRSMEPAGEVEIVPGWVVSAPMVHPLDDDNLLSMIPEGVLFEVRRLRELIPRGLAWTAHMEDWLKKKAAFWDKHWYNSCAAIPLT